MVIIVLAVVIHSLYINRTNETHSLQQMTTSISGQFPETSTVITTLNVRNMTCNRCVNAIRRELITLEGFINVSFDVRARRVIVEHDAALSAARIRERIIEAGFNVN